MVQERLSKESKKNETSKVYCSNCIHFSENSRYGGALKDGVVYDDECKVRLEYRDTWRERESYYKNPRYKNMRNDCKDYNELPLIPISICEYCQTTNIHMKTTDKKTLTICNNEWCIGFLHDATDE